MKKILTRCGGAVLLIMLLANVYVYTKTIVLGDKIVKLETKINQLKLENSEYEKKIASFNSLQNLNAVAGSLGFTEKAKPMYIENFQYALATSHNE